MHRDQLKARIQPELEQDFDALYDEFRRDAGDAGVEAFVDYLLRFGLIGGRVAEAVLAELAPATLAPRASVPSGFSADLGPPSDFDDDDESSTVVSDDFAGALEDHLRDNTDRTWEGEGFLDPDAPTQRLDAYIGQAVLDPSQAPTFEIDTKDMLAEVLSEPASARRRADADKANRQSIESARDAVSRARAELEADLSDPDTDGRHRTLFQKVSGGQLKQIGTLPGAEPRRRRRRRRDGADQLDDAGGRYTFTGTVGEGAMGRVHLAEDSILNRKVAYKAMSEEIRDHAALADRFAAEAQITAQLDHPNIVPVYSLESSSAYTMKLVLGRTLDDILVETRELMKARKRLDEDHSLSTVLELFLRVCDAMAYAHSRGVVHRDLKPENIMVGAFGEAYVMDWGIARLMKGRFDDPVRIAETADEGDLVIGTPGYMSPEQADGRNAELDGRSDQYALGLILFEIVSLKPAVTGKAPLKIVMRHQDGELDPLRHAFGKRIAPELAGIVRKATRRNPAERYPDVRALADDIRRYLRGEAVRAKPDNPLQALQRLIGRYRLATLGLVLFAFAGSFFVVMALALYSQVVISRAHTREQTLANVVTTVARQGSLIDGQFLKYEGLLSLIVATATDNLSRPVRDEDPVFGRRDFEEGLVPDLVASDRYGQRVSLRHAVFTAPALDAACPRPSLPCANRFHADMQRLQDLDRHLYRVLLRSHSEAAATFTPKRAERLLTEVGAPVAWAHVGLEENGVFTQFPGHQGLPEGFDPRRTPWYQLARGAEGPQWGVPAPDLGGLGLILPLSQALYTEDKEFLGVAGVEVSLDKLIEDVLVAPEFKDSDEVVAYIVDSEGQIVVSSDGRVSSLSELEQQTFPDDEVRQAIKERRSGSVQAEGRQIIFNRMPSIGWYYVVSGDTSAFIDLASR